MEVSQIFFWGDISLEARIELVIVDRGTVAAKSYITDILKEHEVPYSGFLTSLERLTVQVSTESKAFS